MPAILCDSLSLMRQLAKMAGMETAGIQHMILVLDVEDIPRLYTAGLIRTETPDAQLEIPEGEVISHQPIPNPIVIDATTMQNQIWRSKLPRLGSGQYGLPTVEDNE